MTKVASGRLDEVAPEFAGLLRQPDRMAEPTFTVPDITVATVMVPMRDGIRLATDVYVPPALPAPVVVMRTPYYRGADANVGAFMALARRGFAVVSQDCRGTGGSEPDFWDYYIREPEDSYDLIEWITHQDFCGGFIGSTGGSYVGQTQWCMAMHPRMSATVPEVSGLGVGINTLHLHMFMNAYARSMGNGDDILDVSYEDLEGIMLDETLATGYFNEPLYKPLPEAVLKRVPELSGLSPYAAQQRLWAYYCSLTNAGRVELIKEMTGARNVTIVEVESLSDAFGYTISHDRHTLPHTQMDEVVRSLHAPPLLVSGWYDWGLNDLFATWDLLNRAAPEPLRARCRMIIAPSSHGTAGYHEGREGHPELDRPYRTSGILEVLARWYTGGARRCAGLLADRHLLPDGRQRMARGRLMADPRRGASAVLPGPGRNAYWQAAAVAGRAGQLHLRSARSPAHQGRQHRLLRVPARQRRRQRRPATTRRADVHDRTTRA